MSNLRRAVAYYRSLKIPESEPLTVDTYLAMAAARIAELESRERMIRDALEDLQAAFKCAGRFGNASEVAYHALKRLRVQLGWLLEEKDGDR